MDPLVNTDARAASISGFWLTTKRHGSLATAEGAAIAASKSWVMTDPLTVPGSKTRMLRRPKMSCKGSEVFMLT
jgi:hypothetical protein